MTLTHNILFESAHDRAMAMIRQGLSLIAIDPVTNTIPRCPAPDEEHMARYMDTLLMTPEEVHEILETLARYVGEQSSRFYESGRNCVNDDAVYDSLCLAAACTKGPSYDAVADMEGLSEEVFCIVNMIESPNEFRAA